jgi:hypothetical protein
MKHKYALEKLVVLKIWPIQVETNFTQDEMKSFEKTKFVLNKRHVIFPQRLFGGESSILINRPMDNMLWPTSHNGKVFHHSMPFKMSNLHHNWWEAGWLFEATINPPLEVPLPRYGWIYNILSSQNLNKKQYEITIRNFPNCICLDFVIMMSNSLG